MKVLVDADACPSIPLITDITENHKIDLFLYCDNTHNLTSTYGTVIICDKGFQSVDIKLMNHILKNDIIITQDYGIAVIALSKGAYVIHPKGKIYTSENIDAMLLERHLNSRQRHKKNIKGPKKRTLEDDERLFENLSFLLKKDQQK